MSVKITFLGTGTSQGVPVIACDCSVCLSEDPKDNRLRSSILIEATNDVGEQKTIAVDSGPDFRQQMLRSKVQQLDAIIFTHKHKDHIAGLDDVRAFNLKYKKGMDLHVNADVEQALRNEFAYAFAGNNNPGIPQLNVHVIRSKDAFINVQGVAIEVINLMHGEMPVLGFKIGGIAYCTDVNYIAEEEKQKLRNLDILVITALQRKTHRSHYNLEQALELIEELNPKKAYLTHVSHYLGKSEEVQKELPKNVFVSYDGLEISSSQ